MKVRGLLSCIMGACMVLSVGGVAATWKYAGDPIDAERIDKNLAVDMGTFIFTPEEMPDEEVSVVQRLSDILNRKYTTEVVIDSWDYLINETIQVYWDNNKQNDPYVGSMDDTFETQIDELFRDVLFETNVSFILKNQDLNGDGFNEISMYSTSDTLDNRGSNYDGVVCVYVTVFTPRIDSAGNIIGYNLVCESLRGYCDEIQYAPGDPTPSFSTDEWRDDVGYTQNGRDYSIPDNTVSKDGDGLYKYEYQSYNQTYTFRSGWRTYTCDTTPYGKTASQVLSGQIPYLSVTA